MRSLIIAIVFGAALLAGMSMSFRLLPQLAPAASDASEQTLVLGQRRPDFRHGRSDGAIVEMNDFDGDVVLVNFWATWCAPCREEMPMLQALSQEWSARGFSLVGIAVDDVGRVRDFIQQLNIGYPILIGGPDVMETNRRWGNRTGALPYSVLVDRTGIVRWHHLGPLTEKDLRQRVAPLLGS